MHYIRFDSIHVYSSSFNNIPCKDESRDSEFFKNKINEIDGRWIVLIFCFNFCKACSFQLLLCKGINAQLYIFHL